MSWGDVAKLIMAGAGMVFFYRIGRDRGRMEGVVEGYRKGLEHNEVIFRIQVGIIERLRAALRGDYAG